MWCIRICCGAVRVFQAFVTPAASSRGLPVHRQSHISILRHSSLLSREMDPEFRAQQERLRAVMAEPVPAIIIAAGDGDVDALRRELDLGVSVDHADAWKSTPLQVACGAKEVSEETGLLVPIERGDRFACAKLLVSRGACLDAGFPGCAEGLCPASGHISGPRHLTPLIEAVRRRDLRLVKLLLSAGADANAQMASPFRFAQDMGNWPLGCAINDYYPLTNPQDPGTPEEKRLCLSIVDALLKAGADANVKRDVSEIEWAIAHDARRLWPILFRGGAVIPTDDDFAAGVFEDYTRHRAHPYLRKIETAGGWKAYEKAHRTKLLATFVPKFTHLVPKELVPLIVEFSFHVGFY